MPFRRRLDTKQSNQINSSTDSDVAQIKERIKFKGFLLLLPCSCLVSYILLLL